MVVSLAFVPIDSIDAACDVLNDAQTGLVAELQPIVDWMEDNYIGRLNRNGTRRNPVFPVRM